MIRMYAYFLYSHGVGLFYKANAQSRWWFRRIAIWNKNRIAVAIAICAWGTNVAFLIYSESIPFSLFVRRTAKLLGYGFV